MHVQRPPMMVGRRQLRHMNRSQGCLLAVLLFFLVGSLLCVASLAVYVLVPVDPFRLLILGLDSRNGEGFATRTDSIMVVGIQPAHIGVLSIPRDLFITAPGYGLQRINTINVLGEMDQAGSGATFVSRSIEQSFAVPIDRYLRLDFQAFTALVDAIGGVDIEVPRRIVDYQFPTENYGTMVVEFEPGWQHMDGATALIYARTRHADDDYGRAARQQQVLQSVSLKLLNPLNWIPATVSVQQYMDTDLNLLEMISLLPALIVNFNDFNMQVINRDYIRPGDGYSVPDYARLQPWIDEYLR